MFKEVYEKCKEYIRGIKSGEQKLSKNSMLIILLAGLLVFVISIPTVPTSSTSAGKMWRRGRNSFFDNSRDVNAAEENVSQVQNVSDASAQYRNGLERDLEEFLSSMEGVGKVKVLIYINSSEEHMVEKDKTTDSSQKNETDIQQNQSEKTVFTTNTMGDEVPFISKTKTPVISGVAVAAQGADNENVRVQIIRMVMALYGLEANKVEVYTLKNDVKSD